MATVRVWPQPFLSKDGASIKQFWFFGVKMMVGQSPTSIEDHLHFYTNLCIQTAQKLNSTFCQSFLVEWRHLYRSQLASYLTKQQLGLETTDKPSYAEVTQGGVATLSAPATPTPVLTTSPSPLPVPSYLSLAATSVPQSQLGQLQPQAGQDFRQLNSLPYNRIFPSSQQGLVPPPTYTVGPVVYSYTHSHSNFQPAPRLDQPYQLGKQVALLPRQGGQVYGLHSQQGRGGQSPQPGGYPAPGPARLAQHSGIRAGPSLKSPQSPAAQGSGQPVWPSPHYRPGPTSKPRQPGHTPNPSSLASYPPPPFSPISQLSAQFNSPPPQLTTNLEPPSLKKESKVSEVKPGATEEKGEKKARQNNKQKVMLD